MLVFIAWLTIAIVITEKIAAVNDNFNDNIEMH